MLEEESGHRAEPDDSTPLLLSCVSAGRWQQALTLLSSVQVTLPARLALNVLLLASTSELRYSFKSFFRVGVRLWVRRSSLNSAPCLFLG